MSKALPALLVTHVGAAALGWVIADKLPVDTIVKHEGFFGATTTTRILATTIESLREEAKLQVYSFKGSPQVATDRTRFYFLGAHQLLIVPATVNYYLDLSGLSLADMRYDDGAKLVRVRLPSLTTGDVAFEPEKATTITNGVLSFSDAQVEELRKVNYGQARRAVIAQAQQAGIVNAAKRQAIIDVERYFSIPLRVAGHPDVKVVATFD
ncbi:DUF4230 domain-containing protein [Sphingomonas citri]